MIFIDEAVIEVAGGNGGNGCIAFRREKYIPRGGPSGGDGGHGGSVYLLGNAGQNTLQHLRYRSRFPAERGRHGEGSNKTGKSGDSVEVPVPLGTQVFDEGTGILLGEVLEEGQRIEVAAGGRGGRGNARFATPTQRAPRHAEPGGEGDERTLRLELKLLADVGLVGLPNAGKSTLISTISAARPKIADYPFTTLVPQLGVVAEGPLSEPFVVADLPGLIEGAAQGAGLGHQFLRHVERCRVLVHLVDLSAMGGLMAEGTAEGVPEDVTEGVPEGMTSDSDSGHGSATEDLRTLERELEAFNPELLERSRLVVGSKSDAAAEDRRRELRAAAAARGLDYLEISSATRQGLDELVHRLRKALREERARAADAGNGDGTDDDGETRR